MAEKSGFWTTDASTPVGDQVASYTQAEWSTGLQVAAGCAKYEGVLPDALNNLAGTVTGANTVAINTGSAMVDGKWYTNQTSQNVNIPSAAAGNTRIDRVLLRADWANFNVSVYRLAGTDTIGTPTAPAITQTSGTTFDIMLYQALVDDAGAVTLTDERVWATAHVDGTTLSTSTGHLIIKASGVDSAQIAAGAIDLAHMSANSVDSDQYVDGSIDTAHIAALNITQGLLAVGASKVTNRQGGNATDWSVSGTGNYTPSTARIQCGSVLTVEAEPGEVAVTFPVAFSNKPIVLIYGLNPADVGYARLSNLTANGFTLDYWKDSGGHQAVTCMWLAIGPE